MQFFCSENCLPTLCPRINSFFDESTRLPTCIVTLSQDSCYNWLCLLKIIRWCDVKSYLPWELLETTSGTSKLSQVLLYTHHYCWCVNKQHIILKITKQRSCSYSACSGCSSVVASAKCCRQTETILGSCAGLSSPFTEDHCSFCWVLGRLLLS